jgi:hypothetical protein
VGVSIGDFALRMGKVGLSRCPIARYDDTLSISRSNGVIFLVRTVDSDTLDFARGLVGKGWSWIAGITTRPPTFWPRRRA